MTPFLLIPLRLGPLVSESPAALPRHQTEESSITDNLRLLLGTWRRECAFRESYGSALFDYDFQHIGRESAWQMEISTSLSEAIHAYEQRLARPTVDLKIEERLLTRGRRTGPPSRVVQITIRGQLETTAQPFELQQTMFISPYAIT